MKKIILILSVIVSFSLVVIILTTGATGCILDSSGLRPSMNCQIADVQAEVDPCQHSYKITGVCFVGGSFLLYELSAVWKKGVTKSQNKASAIVTVNYRNQNYQAYVTAQCPDGDPLLYDVECHSRAIHGSLCSSELWKYYEYDFENHMMPDILSDAKKAELRAEAEWPYIPPEILLPTPNYWYEDPENVWISIKLPFEKGKLSKWIIDFYIDKCELNDGQCRWGNRNRYSIDQLYIDPSGSYVGITRMNLEPGKYRISARAYYCGYSWRSSLIRTPIEFFVKGEMEGMIEYDPTVRIIREDSINSSTFQINEEILIQTQSPLGHKADFEFQKYIQKKWTKFNQVVFLQEKTKKQGKIIISEQKLKIKFPGRYRVRSGKGPWKEFEVRKPIRIKKNI